MMVGLQEVNVAGHMAGTRKRLLKCPLDLRGKQRSFEAFEAGEGSLLEGALGPLLPTLVVATTFP